MMDGCDLMEKESGGTYWESRRVMRRVGWKRVIRMTYALLILYGVF